jgi:hypothetical protein
LNPVLDTLAIAKRYKTVAEILFDEEMIFEDTEECYSDGGVIRRMNVGNFRIMKICDEMYLKAVTSKPHLSVYANKTTAMNLGVKAHTTLALDVESKDLVEEFCIYSDGAHAARKAVTPAGGGGSASPAFDRKVISKQSFNFGPGSGMIGQTSVTGKKPVDPSASRANANAAKRRRVGLPPEKPSGYVQNRGINQFR